jgi:hypothetical protein
MHSKGHISFLIVGFLVMAAFVLLLRPTPATRFPHFHGSTRHRAPPVTTIIRN